MGKTSCKKGQYYCNTDKKCKPIPDGYKVREDGFLVSEGSNPRIPRKAGQPAKSKKHSDLYTDEDPKGTIHGLGFKDVATAKASVAKIRKSSRSHAHKIQAAIAMEQRARVMGKSSEAAVYRKFINSMKKKTKRMNEEKHGDHEPEMIRSQLKTASRASKRIEKHSRKKDNFKAWVQSKITKASDYLDTAADYLDSKDVKEASSPAQQAAIAINMKKEGKKPKTMKEGSLHKWFKGSKSKDGKGGWVNVVTGGTCASDEPGEGTPKCVSSAKRASMSKKERLSAARRKKKADPGQQSKTGAAKPTYVSTDKPKKKKKMKEEFISLPLQLEVPQNDGEFKLGLMFRESLEQDRGMLFVFENTDQHSFHMKNTFIPLDIAFINEEGIIESIKELDPMNPIPVYPDGDVRYAIEVNRGWFAENGIEVGDIILEDTEETEIDLNEVKDKKGKGSGTKDACYHKVKSRYSVWPSAYASGALVKCRKVGAANWGNSRKEEVEYELDEKMNPISGRDTTNEPGALKVYRNVRTVTNLIPAIGKTLAGDKNAFKKMEKKEVERYKNPKGIERVATGIADKMTGDKFDFDKKGPSKTKKEHYDWRSEVDEGVMAIPMVAGGIGKALGAGAAALGAAGMMMQSKKKKEDSLLKKKKGEDSPFKLKKGTRAQQELDPTPEQKKAKQQEKEMDKKLGYKEQFSDWRQELDEKCWPGYEKKGMKTMFGKRYPNCVKKSKKKK